MIPHCRAEAVPWFADLQPAVMGIKGGADPETLWMFGDGENLGYWHDTFTRRRRF